MGTVIDRALLIGGAGLVGQAITLQLTELGTEVFVVDRNQDRLSQVCISSAGPDHPVKGIHCDVRDVRATRQKLAHLTKTLPGLDLLVNCQGVLLEKAPSKLDIGVWDQVVQINLRSAFVCAQTVRPLLLKGADPSIVNIASVYGLVGRRNSPAYVASKHGLVGLTKSMALDFSPSIRVNAILPGHLAEAWKGGEAAERYILRRLPTARDIAEAVTFLAGQKAMTGSGLVIDAGLTTAV